MEEGPRGQLRPHPSAWSDSSARAVLQLMVESVAELVGFDVAALSVVLGDQLVTLAYSGPEKDREYMEQDDPASVIAPLLERAEVWGPRLRFLTGTPLSELEGHWIEVEQVPTDAADAWASDVGLLGVLSNDDGAVVGILSVDRPISGRLPDDRQRSLLERYAAQAERAVLTLFERQALLEQVAHAESARHLIRSASRPTHGSLGDVLRLTHGQLVASFDACGSWLHVFQPDGPGVGAVRTAGGEQLDLPPGVEELAGEVGPGLWAAQEPLVLSPDRIRDGLPPDVVELLTRGGAAWVLGVALGVGDECVGLMALWRGAEQAAWSPTEIASAQQIGHDLGAALMTARALERGRRLVAELQQIDDYRSQLVATLSHELRTPLTVISGNLELLADTGLDDERSRYHQAMGRGTQRMRVLVDDLLMLTRVSNPDHPLVRLPVDLRAVTREVLSLMESTAGSKGLTLTVELGPVPLVVRGDATELDRLVSNLVSNALKYTRPGGAVAVTTHQQGDQVVLVVADSGMGISESDLPGLFRAFFRTTNPEALREAGTGLGLATVAGIADRHGGRVEVDSRLGLGSRFTVTFGPG